MDRREAIDILVGMIADNKKYNLSPTCEKENEALDLAIEALSEPKTIIGIDIPYGSDKGVATIFKGKGKKLILEEVKEIMSVVRCKDCKHYNPPHIKYNDGTRKDYPDELVTVDIGMNVGGKCENSTTTMRTYCTAHDRENPDDFEELVIFRQPMEYCSFGEKAEKHQLSGETSTNSNKNSNKNSKENLSFSKRENDDIISRQYEVIRELLHKVAYMPPVNQKQIISKLKNAENATSEDEESTMGQPKSKLDCISRQQAIDAMWKALYAYEDLTEKQFMEHEELELEDWFQHRIFVQRMHEECMKSVESLPPVTPTEQTGEWIDVSGGWCANEECSLCGEIVHEYNYNYCPNCGAKMGREDGEK